MKQNQEKPVKLLFIGCGNMGFTIAESIANAKTYNVTEIAMHDISKEIEEQVKRNPSFIFYEDLSSIVSLVDYIFIGVKPNKKEEVFDAIKEFLQPKQVIISMMAGITISSLKQGLNTDNIIRIMPNLPAKVNKGATTFVPSNAVNPKDIQFIHSLLETFGIAVQVPTEERINASTAISGSGSAYVFYFYKAMLEAAKDLGFNQDDANNLVSQTFEGALKLLKNNNHSPQDWIDRISSKGGTTEAAIQSLVDNEVNSNIKEAITCAFDKANNLGKTS